MQPNGPLSFTLLGLEAREVQVELALLLFGRVSQGLHNPANHLAHFLAITMVHFVPPQMKPWL
jgi:hypothetical protein